MTVVSYIDELRVVEPKGAFANPYRGWVEGVDADAEAPSIRARHLQAYLSERLDSASLIVVAEAPGYQGARFSGIAMTCERTLLGLKPAVPAGVVIRTPATRTSAPAAARNAAERATGFGEPTATMVWGQTLKRVEGPSRVVLWNTLPFHPHRLGEPLTNRTPTESEVTAHLELLEGFLRLFPGRPVVAVGETAKRHLARLGVEATGVRHPANGGGGAFGRGLSTVFDRLGIEPLRGPQGDLFSSAEIST